MEEKKTIRDEIAIAAMQSILNYHVVLTEDNFSSTMVSPEDIAKHSYEFADAMLKERAKQPNTGE